MGPGKDVVTTGRLVSADGTRIGYGRLGEGPSVILLHGAVNASQHMMKLGRALADAFTVYLPDRRGRGMSGAFGPAYGIQREDEDLAAIVEIICCIVVNVRPRSGNVAWLELVASLPAELDPVLDTEGTLELYRQLDAQVLLMYGSETDPMFLGLR